MASFAELLTVFSLLVEIFQETIGIRIMLCNVSGITMHDRSNNSLSGYNQSRLFDFLRSKERTLFVK